MCVPKFAHTGKHILKNDTKQCKHQPKYTPESCNPIGNYWGGGVP